MVMMMRRGRAHPRCPNGKISKKEGGDLCQQHLELTKIATLTAPRVKVTLSLDHSFLKETLRLSSNTSKSTS